MHAPKRKQQFKPEYAKEFRFTRKGKDDFHAHCTCCNDDVSHDGTSSGASGHNELVQSKDYHQQSSFYGATTSTKLGRLLDQTRVEVLKSSFEEFYSTVNEYVAKWFHSEYLPSNMSWIMLSNPEVSYADVQALASQINPRIAELDSLFDEVTVLNSLIEQVPTEVFNAIGAEEKWIKIFADNEDSLPGIFLLVSAIFSIPVSNAFIERIFSLCGVQWTKEIDSLHVITVKSVVQTKVNFDFSCPQMYSYLLKSNVLLTKIRSWEKYF